jgi:hypothetical protein
VATTARVAELLRLAIVGKRGADAVLTRKDDTPVRDAWQSMCCRAGLGEMLCRECHATEYASVLPQRKYGGSSRTTCSAVQPKPCVRRACPSR